MIHTRFARENLIVARELNSFKARLVCLPDSLVHSYILYICPQKIDQSTETIPNEADVTSLNLHPPSCANMSIYIYIHTNIY
jgi:hypothetical protein